MPTYSADNLKYIRFSGELLPCWAQLLDVASRMSPLPKETQDWFSRFTNANGSDDSESVLGHCRALHARLHDEREQVLHALQRTPDDKQALQIYAAWMYSLETMMQQASSCPTCTWRIEGLERSDEGDVGGGEITLRRV